MVPLSSSWPPVRVIFCGLLNRLEKTIVSPPPSVFAWAIAWRRSVWPVTRMSVGLFTTIVDNNVRPSSANNDGRSSRRVRRAIATRWRRCPDFTSMRLMPSSPETPGKCEFIGAPGRRPAPGEGCPAGAEQAAADPGLVAADDHVVQHGRPVVVQSPADAGPVAADDHVVSTSLPPSLRMPPPRTARPPLMVTPSSRQRPALDDEDRALAVAVDGQQPGAGSDDRGGGRVGQDQRTAAQA